MVTRVQLDCFILQEEIDIDGHDIACTWQKISLESLPISNQLVGRCEKSCKGQNLPFRGIVDDGARTISLISGDRTCLGARDFFRQHTVVINLHNNTIRIQRKGNKPTEFGDVDGFIHGHA